MNKNIKKCLAILLSFNICVSIISCDFDKTQNESFLNDTKAENVKTNIEEAKVLSDISKVNDQVIAVSKLTFEKCSPYNVKALANKLKKDNIEIKKDLNDLAEKKLILLSNRVDKKEVNELIEIEDANFSKAYLNKVSELIASEISQLEYLSTITNDIDFKVLTVQILVKLKYNLSQINKIIA